MCKTKPTPRASTESSQAACSAMDSSREGSFFLRRCTTRSSLSVLGTGGPLCKTDVSRAASSSLLESSSLRGGVCMQSAATNSKCVGAHSMDFWGGLQSDSGSRPLLPRLRTVQPPCPWCVVQSESPRARAVVAEWQSELMRNADEPYRQQEVEIHSLLVRLRTINPRRDGGTQGGENGNGQSDTPPHNSTSECEWRPGRMRALQHKCNAEWVRKAMSMYTTTLSWLRSFHITSYHIIPAARSPAHQ